MMKLYALPLLAPLLALPACGQAESTNQSTIVSVDRAEDRSSGQPASPAPMTDSEATPRPAEVQTFRDWSVACDNGNDSNAAARIAAALPDARSLTVRGAGAETATISSAGASAALR